MANNKIQLADGTILLDLTQDTVVANKLAEGYIAHDASGALIVGTMSGGETSEVNLYASDTEPSDAVNGDYWVDFSSDIEPISVEPFTATANGTYTAPAGKAYSPVTVTIPVYDGSVS